MDKLQSLKIISILVLLFLSVDTAYAGFPYANTYYVNVGGIFQLNAGIVEADTLNPMGMLLINHSMTLAYDPEYIAFSSAESGGLFKPDKTIWSISTTNNSVTIYEGLVNNLSNMVYGNLANFTFIALKPTVVSNIYLTNSEWDGQVLYPLDSPKVYAKIVITGEGSGLPTPPDDPIILPPPPLPPIPIPVPIPTPQQKPIQTIFTIFAENYIQNITQLPESTNLWPDMAWQSGHKIIAWVDILGWDNMTKRGLAEFIMPTEPPIIQYEYLEGSDVTDVKCTTSYHQIPEKTTAYLDCTVTWYHIECMKTGCWRVYHTTYEHFEDTEKTPQYFPMDIPLSQVIFWYQNYTIFNKSSVEIYINNSIYDRYILTENLQNFTKINRIWHVEQTKKNVTFANETIIDVSRGEIGHAQNRINVQSSNFTVITCGFYYCTNKTNITNIIENHDPLGQYTSRFFIWFCIIILFFYYYFKKIKARFI